MPVATGRYAFAQNGADFYILSGQTDARTTDALLHYNATTNTWNSLADAPIASEAPAAAYFGGKIYLVDGHYLDNGTPGPPQLHIYDIASNTWSTGPTRPGAASNLGAAAGAYAGKIFIVGGSEFPSPTLSIYDIASNSWSSGPDAPALFQQGGYTQTGQFFYLAGSYTTNPSI